MVEYNYIEGKKRMLEILNQSEDKIVQEALPKDDSLFHFDNGYKCWVTGIFVDIRDSTSLFEKKDSTVAKMVRCFTSEIIEILNSISNVREIGIRGDCVYAVYSTPYTQDIAEVVDGAVWINTTMGIMNKLFEEKKLQPLKVGIGIACNQDLVIKAGRKGSGINSKVWIGKAVVDASNLSSYGSKNGLKPIIISKCTYDNIIEIYCKNNSNAKSWFSDTYIEGNLAHQTDIIYTYVGN